MNTFQRTLATAAFECSSAIRSRRALVTTLLFAVIGGVAMYTEIGIFSTLEEHLVSALGLPASDNPGAVTMTLWRSEPFKKIVAGLAGSSLVFNDILGQHPIVLAFAGIVFSAVPMLALLTSAATPASAIRSGAVRYVLLRVSRTEWVLGLYLAEAAVLLAAMALMAVTAGAVAFWRLPGTEALQFLPALLPWTLRAWVLAIAWLGVFMGASLMARTPGKATAFAILVMITMSALSFTADNYAPAADFLLPQGCRPLMWRASFHAVLEGVVAALAVSFTYLGVGAAVFARRDI